MASAELEAILAAMFDAEFCAPDEKQAREQARDGWLNAAAERAGIPVEIVRYFSP